MAHSGLRRFFVEEIEAIDGRCVLKGAEAKHVAKVLRMRRGDRLVIMDGRGNRFLATIESASPREVQVSLDRRLPVPPPSPVNITLCPALLKSRSMDYLIQKTSELGVDRILPFSSQRTVLKLEKGARKEKLRRWREIARSSAKQSGRSIPVDMEACIPFHARVADFKGADGLKIILWEAEGAQDLKTLVENGSGVERVVGIIGPEGGFAREEIDIASEAGFTPVSMGHRILRSETAAIAMVAIVQYELGDLNLRHL